MSSCDSNIWLCSFQEFLQNDAIQSFCIGMSSTETENKNFLILQTWKLVRAAQNHEYSLLIAQGSEKNLVWY